MHGSSWMLYCHRGWFLRKRLVKNSAPNPPWASHKSFAPTEIFPARGTFFIRSHPTFLLSHPRSSPLSLSLTACVCPLRHSALDWRTGRGRRGGRLRRDPERERESLQKGKRLSSGPSRRTRLKKIPPLSFFFWVEKSAPASVRPTDSPSLLLPRGLLGSELYTLGGRERRGVERWV